MFLKSLYSSIKESVALYSDYKYKICRFSFAQKEIEVYCECVNTNKTIKFTLNEIIEQNKLKFFSSLDALTISRVFNNGNSSPVESNIFRNENGFYYPLTIAFTVCLIISNLAATKICNLFGLNLPGGTLIFPFLYILNDILTEVYGFSASRKVIWTGLTCNLVVSLVLYTITILPPASYWDGQAAFEYIFSLSPRIFVASCVSYLIGELINAIILSSLKVKFKGQFFALRAIFSTIIGSFTESIIFCQMAFIGRIGSLEIIKMSCILTIIKVTYEVLVMPLTLKIVYYLKISEKRDVFETPNLKKWISFFKVS